MNGRSAKPSLRSINLRIEPSLEDSPPPRPLETTKTRLVSPSATNSAVMSFTAGAPCPVSSLPGVIVLDWMKMPDSQDPAVCNIDISNHTCLVMYDTGRHVGRIQETPKHYLFQIKTKNSSKCVLMGWKVN